MCLCIIAPIWFYFNHFLWFAYFSISYLFWLFVSVCARSSETDPIIFAAYKKPQGNIRRCVVYCSLFVSFIPFIPLFRLLLLHSVLGVSPCEDQGALDANRRGKDSLHAAVLPIGSGRQCGTAQKNDMIEENSFFLMVWYCNFFILVNISLKYSFQKVRPWPCIHHVLKRRDKKLLYYMR